MRAYKSVNGVCAYKREGVILSQLTTSVLNRNEKKIRRQREVRMYSLLSW